MPTSEMLYPYGNMDLHPRLPPTYDLAYYNKIVSRSKARARRPRSPSVAYGEHVLGSFHATLTMARWAIHMATRGETDPRLRAARENAMIERWKRFRKRIARARFAASYWA